MRILYSTDGQSWVEAPTGLFVVIDGVEVPGEDGPGQLHSLFTDEGVVSDVRVTREDEFDHNLAASSLTYAEALSAMIEADK